MGFLTTIAQSVKKSAVAKIVTVAAVAVVGIGGVAGLAYADVFTTPERAIEKATKVMEEASEPTMEKLFGLDALQKAVEEAGAEAGLHLKLEDISGDEFGLNGMTIPNVGVDIVGRADKEDKQDVAIDFKLADTTLVSGKAYIDKEKIQVTVPQLFSDIWYINYDGKEFLQKLKNSYLMEYAGYSKEELDALLEPVEGQDLSEFGDDFAKIAVDLMAARERMLEQTGYEKLEKQELVADGETLECKVYTAHVPKEALKEMTAVATPVVLDFMRGVYASSYPGNEAPYQEFQQELLTELEKLGDLNMTYYVSKKRIVKQDISMDMEEGKLDMEIRYAAEGNPYENMSVLMVLTTPETSVDVAWTVTSEDTEEAYSIRYDISAEEEAFAVTFDYKKLDGSFIFYAGQETMSVTLEGAFDEVDHGKKVGLELDKVLLQDGSYVQELSLNASLYVKVLEDSVSELEGNQVDLLAMTAEDVQAWTNEVSGNVYKILFSMMGFFE